MKQRNADNLAALKKEQELQNNISAVLTRRAQGHKQITESQEQLLSELKGEKDVSNQIIKVQEAKNKILEEQAATGKDIGKALLKQLDDLEYYLEIEKEIKDNKQKQKDKQKELNASRNEA